MPNPHRMPTAFGLPQIIGRGNVFERHDRLAAALRDACDRLEKAGFPASDLEAALSETTTTPDRKEGQG